MQQQQQRPSKLPLVIGVVLIAATIARHRRHARYAEWQATGTPGGPGAAFGRHGHHHRLAARLADCAARMADARDVEYV